MEAARRARGSAAALTALCLVQFIDVLGVTVVVTALPRMLASLHASPSAGSGVSAGYAMFFGGLLMLGARLGDRFGHRRAITAGLAVSALGALLGAVAGSVVLLTAARCLQGAGAAASVPSALRLLTVLAPDGPPRRRAVAAWSASGALAGASGFVVGGVVTDLASWRWVFWAYLPLTAALAAVIGRRVPTDSRRPGAARSLNAPASATFTLAVMAVVVGTTLIALPGERVAGTVVVVLAAPLTVAFVGVDRRARAPLLPAAVLARPDVRAGAAGAFLNTATTSSAMTLVTLYLQDGLHHSPLAAAAMLLPFSLAVIAGSALAAPALRRISARRVLAGGLGLIALADAGLCVSGFAGSGLGGGDARPGGAAVTLALPGCVAVAGAGLGLASVAATTLGTAVPEALRGAASGIVNTAAQLGTAIGIAVLLLVAAATTGAPGVRAPVIAWAAAAVIGAMGAIAFCWRRRSRLDWRETRDESGEAVPSRGGRSSC